MTLGPPGAPEVLFGQIAHVAYPNRDIPQRVSDDIQLFALVGRQRRIACYASDPYKRSLGLVGRAPNHPDLVWLHLLSVRRA